MQKMKLGLAVALAACILSGCGKEQNTNIEHSDIQTKEILHM